MTASQYSTCFIPDLETEKCALQAFIEILKKEENALTQGKIEEIDYLASDKSRLIEQLIRLDDQRNTYLQQCGFSPEENNIDSWLRAHHPDQSAVQILWNELLELARIAQQLNHSNGLIISTYLQHNQRASAALHCAAGNVSLYGPQGQAYI